MPQLYPFGKLPNYPHMKPADVAIWERFINLYPDAYDNVMYDLTVGESVDTDQAPDDPLAKSWGMLNARKIDVVGFKATRVDVIEVKPHAGPSAIGQVVGYMHLYHGYRDPSSLPNPVLVTDTDENDMSFLCARLNVRRVIV